MWVYAHNGHKVGPVDFEEIVNQINAGVIVETTPVCSSGEKPCRAGQHPKLQQFFIAINSSSEPQAAPVNEPAPQVAPAIITVSGSKTSASTHKNNRHRKLSFNKKSANSNQMKIIGIAIAVIVALGLFFVFRGGGVSNFAVNKVPKTIKFTDDDTVDNLRSKAQSGNMEAQFKLAMLLDDEDHEHEKWLKKSAENGYAPAQYQYGVYLRQALTDPQEGEQWLQKAIDQNYPTAIAHCYLLGIIFESDFAKGKKILKDVAEEGDSVAQTYLGVLYFVKKDNEQARYWLHQAAEQGYPMAQYTLFNKLNEKKWAYGLAKKGVISAQLTYAIDTCNSYERNPGSVSQETLKEAVTWVKNAAENDNAQAQYNLGLFYFYGGCGIDQDNDIAYKWIQKSADNGYSAAEQFLRENF